MNPVASDILMHYGVKRRSGRYPWGSGENPYQHDDYFSYKNHTDFMKAVNKIKSEGVTDEKEIASRMHMTTTELRMQLRAANHIQREIDANRARALREEGKTLQEVADIMGYKNESSIRALLNENTAANKNRARMTADILKKEIEEKGMLDVGKGVEQELGVTRGVLDEALFLLATEGYPTHGYGLPQVTQPGQQTIVAVLCKPGVEQGDVYNADPSDIKSVGNYTSIDGGLTFNKIQYPQSISSDRIMVRYGDEGGIDKDGVIELRRGVDDLSLGNAHYAQVRILADDTHYLKGMAIYSDDMPDGVDVIFNTNKPSGTSKDKVFKPIKNDPENPFGAYISAKGQSWYIGKDGEKHLSAINKIKEEGEWDKMDRNLSSQFLSKQPMPLIHRQLDLTYKDAVDEYNDILAINNPTVKKQMLLDFADNCDSAAVHLKAAALPRQTTQVILPLTKIKEDEIFAPAYKNGEKVALVRYPHAGTFEIPILTVNNKNKQGIDNIGLDVIDAVGIHPKAAKRLSGADFDGDQVVVIPISSKVKIKSTNALKDLEDFEPKTQYPEVPGMKYMSKKQTQREMGMISNLITDMTLAGAGEDEIARAVKHSMVVIDAEKHKLNYKQSEKDQGIAELKKKYQGYISEDGKEVGGASTLLSRKNQDIRIPERQGSGRIDPYSGEVIFKESGRTYLDKKTGKVVPATTKVSLLSVTKDLRKLSSGTPQENAYADYGNKMKALANEARKTYLATGEIPYSSNAKKVYLREYDSLSAKLNLALKEAPKERRAQAIANSKIKAKIAENPDMDAKDIKRASQQAIESARNSVGKSGKATKIYITDREWEAIQAGAISPSKLKNVLKYADDARVRELATPRTRTRLSEAKIAKMKAMQASGYTSQQIAESVGVSPSTVYSYLKGDE